jgi:hypothetical protein
MATLQTSLSEYLQTSYHPDRDYVDGEVQERNLGEFDHAAVQVFLSSVVRLTLLYIWRLCS